MAKRKRRPEKKKVTPNPITVNLDAFHRRMVDDIRRIIERIAARHHRRVDRVFEDWLRMVDAMQYFTPFPVAELMAAIVVSDAPRLVIDRLIAAADAAAAIPLRKISLTKLAPGGTNAGDTLAYTLLARNEGETSLRGLRLTDTLPQYLTPLTITRPGAHAAQNRPRSRFRRRGADLHPAGRQ